MEQGGTHFGGGEEVRLAPLYAVGRAGEEETSCPPEHLRGEHVGSTIGLLNHAGMEKPVSLLWVFQAVAAWLRRLAQFESLDRTAGMTPSRPSLLGATCTLGYSRRREQVGTGVIRGKKA